MTARYDWAAVRATWRRVSSAEILAIATWSEAWFFAAHPAAASTGYDSVAAKVDWVLGWVMLPSNPRAASSMVVPAPP